MTARRIVMHPLLWTAVVFVVLPFIAGANPFAGEGGFIDDGAFLFVAQRRKILHETFLRFILDPLQPRQEHIAILLL